MPKNIVICDGTGNEFGDHNSNVVKLYGTLIIDSKQQFLLGGSARSSLF